MQEELSTPEFSTELNRLGLCVSVPEPDVARHWVELKQWFYKAYSFSPHWSPHQDSNYTLQLSSAWAPTSSAAEGGTYPNENTQSWTQLKQNG
jgi:hypothetical protein